MLNVHTRSATTFFVCLAADSALVVATIISSAQFRILISRRNPRLVLDDDDSPELELSYLRRAGGGQPKRFRYEELRAATDDFQSPIGRGGSGSVFKGVLAAEGQLPVAVKRIEGEVHGEREFRSEITAVVCVQHVNLVRILGYCLVPGGHRYLVYEYIQNGSLDSWIFSESRSRSLTWGMRYRVAMDVARALAYLHDDCHSRILHLDVKPQNILLDENFRARVSDFGISRLMGRDESRVVTTVRGTRGYLPPEWFTGEGVSDKSDVYSYGMVLLELVGGRKNAEFVDVNGNASQRTWRYFLKTASEKMREGKLMEVVDERVVEVDEDEVRRLVYVALWCIQERAELRPRMEDVVSILKGHVAVDMPPETRMFLVDMIMPINDSSTSDAATTDTSLPQHTTSIPSTR